MLIHPLNAPHTDVFNQWFNLPNFITHGRLMLVLGFNLHTHGFTKKKWKLQYYPPGNDTEIALVEKGEQALYCRDLGYVFKTWNYPSQLC